MYTHVYRVDTTSVAVDEEARQRKFGKPVVLYLPGGCRTEGQTLTADSSLLSGRTVKLSDLFER